VYDVDNVHLRTHSVLEKLHDNFFKQYVCNWIEILHVLHAASNSAKFRCGFAPFRLETGRYERQDVLDRICNICYIDVESE
ncbi:hypothetical protein MAR_015893, partial [Mya arenaria]